MKYRNTLMFKTLFAAEAMATRMGAGHVATQVWSDSAPGFGVMRLSDRAVFGVGAKMVPGSAW